MSLHNTQELIEEIRAGRMIILMDDEERENEGDFVIAASAVRAEHINFMARHGRGLICLTLTQERCRRLGLSLMVRDTYYHHGTNFTVSIEAAQGVTTGISAADRALTVQTAVATDAKPTDLTQPGHIFPLMAQPGGVLRRAGHTEAGCDLARLAGLVPAAVIVEILNDDGTMARRPELEQLARQFDLKIGTIADLIRYRVHNEKTVVRVADTSLRTEFGEFRFLTYRDTLTQHIHFAMVKGEITAQQLPLVRVHLENPLYDLTTAVRAEGGWPLRDVLKRVGQAECGVVVILCHQFDDDDLISQVQRWSDPLAGADSSAPITTVRDGLRTIGLGAQILSDIGVKKMCVMSRARKFNALSGFGLEVVEYVD